MSEAQSKEMPEQATHHEQNPQAQKTFLDRVNKLSVALLNLGSPFQEESPDLYSIDTKDIAHPNTAELLKTHMNRGHTKFQEFSDALASHPASMYEPIKKNVTDFFRQESASPIQLKQRLLKKRLSVILQAIHFMSDP